jgi:hypothetical protein
MNHAGATGETGHRHQTSARHRAPDIEVRMVLVSWNIIVSSSGAQRLDQ